MTVLVGFDGFGGSEEPPLPSFCLSCKIQCQETTGMVLAVSAVVAVPVVTATPLKLNPPFSVILRPKGIGEKVTKNETSDKMVTKR